MASFKDLMTGNTLETDNEFALSQFRNHPDRYQEMTSEPPVEPETVEQEAEEEKPVRRGGRPKKTT